MAPANGVPRIDVFAGICFVECLGGDWGEALRIVVRLFPTLLDAGTKIIKELHGAASRTFLTQSRSIITSIRVSHNETPMNADNDKIRKFSNFSRFSRSQTPVWERTPRNSRFARPSDAGQLFSWMHSSVRRARETGVSRKPLSHFFQAIHSPAHLFRAFGYVFMDKCRQLGKRKWW